MTPLFLRALGADARLNRVLLAARIATDGRSVIDIAREIVTLTGWCG